MPHRPTTPTAPLPKLSRAAKRALAAAYDAPDRRLWCVPKKRGLSPRARWNLCLALQQCGYARVETEDHAKRLFSWILTPAGETRARLERGIYPPEVLTADEGASP